MPARCLVKMVEALRKCFHSIIPIIFADDNDDNESDDVELLHPSPRFCRNPSTILETVSTSDSEHVTLLELSVSTTAVAESAALSPGKNLLMTEKKFNDLKHCGGIRSTTSPRWKILLLAAFKQVTSFGNKNDVFCDRTFEGIVLITEGN